MSSENKNHLQQDALHLFPVPLILFLVSLIIPLILFLGYVSLCKTSL